MKIIVQEKVMQSGYYRYPAIHNEAVAFVCEDDIWLVPAGGGLARRLTSGLAEASRPRFSNDGQMLVFTGREEGQPDLYLMAAEGADTVRPHGDEGGHLLIRDHARGWSTKHLSTTLVPSRLLRHTRSS